MGIGAEGGPAIMTVGRSSKVLPHTDHRIEYILRWRTFISTFKTFDKRMNLALYDCDEFRRIGPKDVKQPQHEKSEFLGQVLLCGKLGFHDSEGKDTGIAQGTSCWAQGGPGVGRAVSGDVSAGVQFPRSLLEQQALSQGIEGHPNRQ